MSDPTIEINLNGETVQTLHFDKDTFNIGRLRENDIVIDDLSVSRWHARLVKEDGELILEDQDSENGCFLNGARVTRSTIHPDDEIFVSRYQLIVRNDDSQVEDVGAKTVPGPELRREMGTVFAVPKPATVARNAVLILKKADGPDVTIPWDKDMMYIGRSSECDISLFHAQVSRQHTRLIREDGRFILEDLGTVNGTKLNGKRVSTHGLVHGDVISVGTNEIVFRYESNERPDLNAQPDFNDQTQPPTLPPPTEMDSVTQSPMEDFDILSTGEDANASADSLDLADESAPAGPVDYNFTVLSDKPMVQDLPEPNDAALKETPVDAIVATPGSAEAISSLFDASTDAAKKHDPLGSTTKPSDLVAEPATEPAHSDTPVFEAAGIVDLNQPPPLPSSKQELPPSQVETRIKLKPTPSGELCLELSIDPDSLDDKTRAALEILCDKVIDLPVKLRFRSK